MGSLYYPTARVSAGLWALGELLARTPAAAWQHRADLLADVAEVGDTVYVRPAVHIVEHNRLPLERVRDFLGLPVDKVRLVFVLGCC